MLPNFRGEYLTYTTEQRKELLRQTILYKIKIKDAAANIGYNYSTAKHIVKQFKNSNGAKAFVRPKPLDFASWPFEIKNTFLPIIGCTECSNMSIN